MKKFDIEITRKAQLIDLNDSEKNFQIKFKVVTENEEDFLAIVLNKEELDKYSDLNEVEMKKSPGIIKGTLECNEDKTENYFLVVKNEGDPCKATVEIDINEIEKFVEIDEQEYNSDQQRLFKENSINVLFNKYFYHILGFLIVLSLIYYFYSSKKSIFVTSFKSVSPSGGPPLAPSGGPPSAPSVSTVVPPTKPELGTTPTTNSLSVSNLSSPSPSIVSEGCADVSSSIQKGLSILEKLETR